MKLLVITQEIDRKSPTLGFFCSWLNELSKGCENIVSICLRHGEYEAPQNVKVLSLGKEEGRSKIKYVFRLYKYLWQERKNYDAVFVHMNQEYVLLAGLIWRLSGKKILFWRNHKMGNWLTNIAVSLSNVVFYTSPESYTAKFKKARLMPTGIDIAKFKNYKEMPRAPRSILSMGRISKVKGVNVLIDALNILDKKGIDFKATIVGDPDEHEKDYYDNLLISAKPLIEKGVIIFKKSMPNTMTPEMYKSHEIFVNLTKSGSLDKTIFSAMSSGALTVVCNEYFRGVLKDEFIFKSGDKEDLANKLGLVLALPGGEKKRIIEAMKKYVDENHSLEATIEGIIKAIK